MKNLDGRRMQFLYRLAETEVLVNWLRASFEPVTVTVSNHRLGKLFDLD